MPESYQNPIYFFGFDSQSLADIDAKQIRRAKRELLAEIELVENGFIEHQGKEISKETVIQISEQLADPQLISFYAKMADWPQMEAFLSQGDLQICSHASKRKLLEWSESLLFKHFFCQHHNHIFDTAYRSADWRKIYLLAKLYPFIPEAWHEDAYQSTYLSIRGDVDATLERYAQKGMMIHTFDDISPIDWQTALCFRFFPSYFDTLKRYPLSLRRKWIKLKVKAFFYTLFLWGIWGLILYGLFRLIGSFETGHR